MPLSKLAIHSGQWLGYGLRQSINIGTEPFVTGIEDAGAFASVVFKSNSGELVSELFSGYGLGAKLNLEMNSEKIGGLIGAKLTILKKNNIPLFNNMIVDIYIKSVKWFTGYIQDIPETDTNSEIIELSIIGFIKKLKESEKIKESYTATTIEDIIIDLKDEIIAADVNYNEDKIAEITTAISRIEFNDKSLFSIMDRLRRIANLDYDNIRYNFGVDAEKDFYFSAVEIETTLDNYFEGYHFQNPDVENSTGKLINNINVYRAKLPPVEKETEIIAVYSDQASIDENGKFNKKLMISDYLDTTTAENIANGLLKEFAVNKKRVSINNLITNSKLADGFYNVSNKPQFQKFVIDECNDVNTWDLVDTGTVNFDVTFERAFTGRQCFDFDLDTSSDTILTREFDKHYVLDKAILYLRSETVIDDIFEITFTGETTDRGILFANGKAIVTSGNKNIKIKTVTKTTQVYTVGFPIANEWQRFEFNLSNFRWLNKVQIKVLKDDIINTKIDHLELYTNSFYTNYLELEKATYVLNDTSLLTNASFGDISTNLNNEILKIDAKNSTAVDIFSKS